MPYIIQIEPHGFQDIEIFYEEFLQALDDPAKTSIVFDFEEVDFITVEVLLALICASKCWRVHKGTKVVWRANEKVKPYLERANILQALANDIVISEMTDEYWTRGASLSLMEIREIANDVEANSLDVSNTVLVASHLLLGRVSTQQLGGVCTLLSELTQNIIHCETIGYAFMQSYQNSNAHQVHIGVVDVGIGIVNSLLPKYPDLTSASEYLVKSLQAGVSSSNSGNGLGLFQVENIVSKGRGALTLRSGTAVLGLQKRG